MAGVGTANWPLTGRHARFIVAKHDLVTTLDGIARNTRDPIEDDDTRAVDRFLGELVPDSSASQLSLMSLLLYPRTIHALDRYLRSEESGPMILNYLDELYQTCAIGQVTVMPTPATLQLGGAAVFTAAWSALDGQRLTTSDSVKWSIDSELASVSQLGRVVAGNSTGTVALRARVRSSVGTADITIVDDSVRALYVPPIVSVVERMATNGPFPPGPAVCDAQFMTITASAMSGAYIVSAELVTRLTYPDDMVFYNRGVVPLDTEFIWRNSSCTVAGRPSGWVDMDNWYRLVVTDSHGLVTEITGPNP